MESQYENCYLMTKERYISWVKHPISKNYFSIVWILMMIVTLLLSLNYIMTGDIVFSIFFLYLTFFCVYRRFFRARLMAAKVYKTLCTGIGAVEWERVIRLNGEIEVIDANTTGKYQWNHVLKIIENEKYIILALGRDAGIRLDKAGFTIGTAESLLLDIRQKYSNIEIVVK
jgi:hypothetical protein